MLTIKLNDLYWHGLAPTDLPMNECDLLGHMSLIDDLELKRTFNSVLATHEIQDLAVELLGRFSCLMKASVNLEEIRD